MMLMMIQHQSYPNYIPLISTEVCKLKIGRLEPVQGKIQGIHFTKMHNHLGMEQSFRG